MADSVRNSSEKIDIKLDHIFTKGRVYKYSHWGIVLIVLSILAAFISIYVQGIIRYSYQTLVYSEIYYKSDTLDASSRWIQSMTTGLKVIEMRRAVAEGILADDSYAPLLPMNLSSIL